MRDLRSVATLFWATFVSLCLLGCNPTQVAFQETDAEILSTWGLMRSDGEHLSLSEDVIPYQLNSALFTDYAHKLRTVTLPEGFKATANEDGSINAQGVDFSKIVPHLVAAIQELTTRLAALENR